jgi:hypothetical protein
VTIYIVLINIYTDTILIYDTVVWHNMVATRFQPRPRTNQVLVLFVVAAEMLMANHYVFQGDNLISDQMLNGGGESVVWCGQTRT